MGRQTQTRERLVRTAGELFWSQGYAQTGVSSIMKQARATSGSFYHFFSTKEDLLLAVLDAVGELISTDILETAETNSRALSGRISNLTDAYRTRTAPNAPGFGVPVGTLVGELGPDHAEAIRRVEKIYAMVVSRVADWLIDADNRWSSDDDPRRLAGFIVGALEGASMMAVAGGSSSPIDECAEQIRVHLESLAIGRSSRADEMPPPEPSVTEGVDWKAW